jgi:uncharacterized protein YndB with AHSA1/START domain
MTESSSHGSFTVERRYPASPARVFAAWADAAAKDIWMDDPDYKSDGTPHELDFRVGGHETFGGLNPDGTQYRYDARYYDIVPGRRIVYCYEMHTGDQRISVSLATAELVPDAGGTKLTYTEQGVFLDGIEKPESREEGWAEIMTGLGQYLASTAGH